MSQHVAFLRGINVGGRQIKMDALRKTFDGLGYKNVKTILASGNVVFETKGGEQKALRSKIETGIKKDFGFEVSVIVRSAEEIRGLVEEDPFKRVKVTPKTRLYITFLADKPQTKLKVPYKSLAGDYTILQVTSQHVISVLTLTPKSGTVDVMDILAKEFGANITTRNWNTVNKIVAVMKD